MVNKVNFEVREVEDADGNKVKRPVPNEPQIGATRVDRDIEATVQAGYARAATSAPPKGQSGEVEQLDNQGKPTKVHPGEIAGITRREGSQAAADKLDGKTPPGDPQPKSAGKKGS